MIQRIQTIMLLLAAVAMASLIFMPFATSAETAQGIFADGNYTVTDSVTLELLAAAGVVISLIVIFLFKNRARQIQLSYLLVGICMVLPALVFTKLMRLSAEGTSADITWGWFMPAISLIFTVCAIYYISKDDKLVKSLDRLR